LSIGADISAQAGVTSPALEPEVVAGDELSPGCDSLLEVLALRLWQLSMWCHRRGFRPGARLLKSLIFLFFGAILEPDVKLDGHVNFAHRGLGVVIHGSTVLGDWVQIWQYVTIASNNDKQAREHTGVRVEKGAVIGAHALIMCPADRTLTIGEGAIVGAGAIVVDDVPARALVLPEPSRVIARSD
jgi:serine O-acetyltransferase